MLHSNEQHCAVPKSSFTRSVLESDLVYNFTNMHAMSYRSDLFTCNSTVNI